MKFKDLQGKVVVITGASSGIGKLATEEFLKQGAKVVLAARSIDEMLEHLMELNTDETHALAVQTDVSDSAEVAALAHRARNHFGKIDVWINNAAISAYGHFETQTPEDTSRIIDVNLKGQMYGARAALQIFKQQGYGNLLNVSSVLGRVPAPLQSAYVATKHGIVGFSNSLREELINQGKACKEIKVSVILPGSMDTPFFTHAKSEEGIQPCPMPPVYDPMVAVREMIRCAKNPVPEVVAGNAVKSFVHGYRIFPRFIERYYMGRSGVRQQLTDIPKPIDGDDNLFAPMPNTQDIRGGYGTTGDHLKETVTRHPVRVGLAVAVPVFLLTFFLRNQRRPA